MSKKTVWWVIVLIVAVVGAAAVWFMSPNPPSQDVVSPKKDEQTVKNEKIRVFEPVPQTIVTSPLVVKGEARGPWYFEASFPVHLFDANGKELAVKAAQAQGEWMTEEFVPFEVILEFAEPSTDTGTLVLENDNPSGLPEHAAEIRIPVRFSIAQRGKPVDSLCRTTGCSGQVCADEDVMTTCEYREEYACYKTARCERQNNGRCGWTETAELQKCLLRTR